MKDGIKRQYRWLLSIAILMVLGTGLVTIAQTPMAHRQRQPRQAKPQLPRSAAVRPVLEDPAGRRQTPDTREATSLKRR